MSEHARFPHVHPAPARKRWLAVLLASVLFHWIAVEWVNGNLVLPMHSVPEESLLTAQLHSAVTNNAAPNVAPVPKRPAPKSAARQPAAPARPATMATATQALTRTPAQDSADTAQESASVPGAETEAEPMPPPAKPRDEEVASPDFRANLPPSVELKYDVQAHKKGFSYYGTGTIHWQTDGSRYAIQGKAKAAFFTVLEFKSEGEVDKTGIAPVLYAERAGNRAETNTHFHRERNTISFSASSLSYPRIGGEQDRASIIWQLAATGRTHPELFKPGEELSIFVAGVRNAAPWRIHIIGEEEVQFDTGPVKSWHVKSVPQQGGYEKTFDIWFASGYEWYPVKLRQTEVSGDYLELTLSNPMLAQH
jgi:hypothetical protein